MAASLMLALVVTMIGTAFLSGIFGMAGGLILIGVLLALLPLPEAMALHAVTQIASNGWRGLLWWRHVRWRAVGAFLCGCALAFAAWLYWRYVPSTPVAFLMLGVTPFLVRLLPVNVKPNPENIAHGTLYGSLCMSLMLLTGVSGPLIDTYFLGGNLDRRQIVASKAVCQIFGHAAKFVYFGGLVAAGNFLDPWLAAFAVIASIAGTSLARPILERLSDMQYRRWANHIITAIAIFYLAQGGYLLLRPSI